MKLDKVLRRIGLKEKEARIYLALLQLREGDVTEIAKEAKIKRPTAYLVLEHLEEKGLVKQNYLHKKRSVFMAEPPKVILEQLTEKEQTLKEVLPQMLSTYLKNKKSL